jgi:phosphatidylinositol alpha-1,6-mannosyltransferase
MQFCYNGASLILPNSKYTLSLLRNTHIKNENIVILYPGADEELFDCDKFTPLPKKRKDILLTVGALSIRKGHRQVLDALNIMRQSNQDLEYWIIGKGEQEAELRSYVQLLELDKFVHFWGFVPREKLPQYYNGADIFILASNDHDPTQVEGFGIVLAEANLMKKPVIGSIETGMEDIIINGYNGFLLDTKNSKKLANTIKSLLADKQKARLLGENGYKHVKSNFTWTKFGEELNKIIIQKFNCNPSEIINVR